MARRASKTGEESRGTNADALSDALVSGTLIVAAVAQAQSQEAER